MDTNNCESLIPLSAVPKLGWLPKHGGKELHLATLYRWVERGARGQKLQVVWVGGRMATTEEWVREFIQNTTAAGTATPPVRTTRQRQRAVERAQRELAEAGI